jgi:hypothetical protein
MSKKELFWAVCWVGVYLLGLAVVVMDVYVWRPN